MSNISGYWKTCDVCGFSEFVPNSYEPEADKFTPKPGWNNIVIDAKERVTVCSPECLSLFAIGRVPEAES